MRDTSLIQRLEALASFAPVFEAPGFSFGDWDNSPGHLPWFSLSTEATRFVSTASQFDWIIPDFNWPEWRKTDRAHQLLENPDAIASATVEDLEHLLTTHFRADRFVEGHLAAAFEAGQLQAIVRRAAALARASEESAGHAETAS